MKYQLSVRTVATFRSILRHRGRPVSEAEGPVDDITDSVRVGTASLTQWWYSPHPVVGLRGTEPTALFPSQRATTAQTRLCSRPGLENRQHPQRIHWCDGDTCLHLYIYIQSLKKIR